MFLGARLKAGGPLTGVEAGRNAGGADNLVKPAGEWT
jgi:hypothetical protein